MGPRPRLLAVAVLALLGAAPLVADPPAAPVQPPAPPEPPAPKGGIKVERYPPSWRMKVADAIKRGAEAIAKAQSAEGRWAAKEEPQALGHTSLAVLTLLKSGTLPEAPEVVKAFGILDALPITQTYGAGCYLMALAARYHPSVDTLDTDVGTKRAARIQPEAVRASLSPKHKERFDAAVAFLVRAQTSEGLWFYGEQPDGRTEYDLSNTQYALLGLRAAADCGIDVPEAAWRAALKALLAHQEDKGPKVELVGMEEKDGYAFALKEAATARGFRYKDEWKNGMLGEKTVPLWTTTGSMTVSGLAGLAIAREGLWRSRRFTGKDRKQVDEALRDGLAWVQLSFSVTENPGAKGANHLYYLYGLERMGMLVERRWIGTHDWYKEGADQLLLLQKPDGSWGDHVATAFAVLFLKRATAPPAVAVSGG